MKRFFNIPLAIIILASALTIGAQAQSSSAQRINATIPFAFTVGHKSLPAGKYTIEASHRKAGKQTLEVEVPATGSKEANFTLEAK